MCVVFGSSFDSDSDSEDDRRGLFLKNRFVGGGGKAFAEMILIVEIFFLAGKAVIKNCI